jgi:hypothetical protein
MKTLISMIILFFLLGFSCHENEEVGNCYPFNDFVIKTGVVCGWCAGADSLSMTKAMSNYIFTSCDETMDKETVMNTNREKWNELLESFNWDDFTQINVNTCAMCADGCDAWIFVQNNGAVHQIRFTDDSPEIEPIRTFVEKLDALRKEFKQN